MRELVYTGFMSLDGVLDSPGGEREGHRSGGWVANA
ncbi:MAG: dihydrofolate reductase family protein, partial [Stackebrandtia sp.]